MKIYFLIPFFITISILGNTFDESCVENAVHALDEGAFIKEMKVKRDPWQIIVKALIEIRLKFARTHPDEWWIINERMPDPQDIKWIRPIDEIIAEYMDPDDPILAQIAELKEAHESIERSP